MRGLHFMYCEVTGISRPYSLCPIASQEYSSTNNKTKISKQSALAVSQPLEIINNNPSADMCLRSAVPVNG